jgi:hypothetical protein
VPAQPRIAPEIAIADTAIADHVVFISGTLPSRTAWQLLLAAIVPAAMIQAATRP